MDHIENWTREGFYGDYAVVARPNYTPDYLSVEGPHAPHRLTIADLKIDDRVDPRALPTTFATSRAGVRLSASAREEPMPFVVRNVEADELHFVQQGELEFMTAFGPIVARPGDFLCIPRAVSYRVTPLHTPTLSVMLESPQALHFDTPTPVGMVHLDRDLERPRIEMPTAPGGETELLLKCEDGVTRYLKPTDPLAAVALIAGQPPVWKLNLANVHPLSYGVAGGPPMQFLSAGRDRDLLLYTLSARPGPHPPIHHNADYDEIIYYYKGPGAWGAVDEPGTFTWVPKGVTHHGPDEDVAEGYLAWLLESRATLRLTSGLAAAELMETANYGRKDASPVAMGEAR
ncbi:MAG TPA: homogentisate 1,2-dioxygenase [Chloroflexota bacterium]